MINPISRRLYEALARIPVSKHRDTEYRPAQLRLKDGAVVPCAYLFSLEEFKKGYGAIEEGPQFISIDAVEHIEDCPHRLPADLATRIHNAGESGMGYCLFTARFSDGTKTVFNVGSSGLDFVDCPEGKSPKDIVDVVPHSGSIAEMFGRARAGREFKLVLYDGIAPHA